jgi:hypothetical protein
MSIGWKLNEANELKQKEPKMIDKDTQEVELPRTLEQLNNFFATVIGAYDLPDDERTKEMIATAVVHAPQDKSWLPLGYFGHRVRKSQANLVAYNFVQEIIQREALKKQADTKIEGAADVINIKD